MEQVIRWGILGCGHIAEKFAADLHHVSDAALVAVGARRQSHADGFGRLHGVSRCYGSYEELVGDTEVDIIYVATPHGLHHTHVMLCLAHKKAVLCEKAFAINHRQTQEMIATAQREKIFLMEAMWVKFTPLYALVQQLIQEGLVGELQGMITNFGFKPEPPYPFRLFDPALGGGSLLDIGVYNVFLTVAILGRPDTITAVMKPAITGVDEQCAATFGYRGGVIAQLYSTLASNLATEADIFGDKGRIKLSPRFYNTTTAHLEYYPSFTDLKQVVPHLQEPGFGYQYQIRHVSHCLLQGLAESPIMTHADTLVIMETMDRIRESAGLKYPADAIL